MDRNVLAQYILSERRLIIPGLGAFLHKTSSKNTAPPLITFSPFLKYNDGGFENLLAERQNLAKSEARKLIRLLIEEINQAIQSEGFYEIPAIGQLQRDSKGALVLSGIPAEPIQSTNKSAPTEPPTPTPPSAPTAPTAPTTTPLQRSKDEAKKNIPKESTTEASPNLTPPLKSESKPDKPLPHTLDNNPIPPKSPKANRRKIGPTINRKRIIRILTFTGISITLAFIIAYLIRTVAFDTPSLPSDDNFISTENLNLSLDTISDKESAPTDTYQATFDSLATVAEQTAQKNHSTPKTTTPPPSSEDLIEKELKTSRQAASPIRYYLIIGSFRNKANALELISTISKQGGKAYIVARKNGLWSVSYGRYTNRQQADKAKRKLSERYPGAWVMKQAQ